MAERLSGPIVGLIPARGGSKGILRKNIVPLAGKPLMALTIEATIASGALDRVIVSTEDLGIAEVARPTRRSAGALFRLRSQWRDLPCEGISSLRTKDLPSPRTRLHHASGSVPGHRYRLGPRTGLLDPLPQEGRVDGSGPRIRDR